MTSMLSVNGPPSTSGFLFVMETVTVAVPTPWNVATPKRSTVTTSGLLLVQVRVRTVGRTGVVTVSSCSVPPTRPVTLSPFVISMP